MIFNAHEKIFLRFKNDNLYLIDNLNSDLFIIIFNKLPLCYNGIKIIII